MANSESPPLTAATLTAGLRACGVREGQTVLVQMAMSKLGFVVGAAQAVADGLLAAVGPSGTIVVPTHSADNSEPSHWQHPPVPESWWLLIREHTPAYNPLNTPTRQMGAVAELLRRWPPRCGAHTRHSRWRPSARTRPISPPSTSSATTPASARRSTRSTGWTATCS